MNVPFKTNDKSGRYIIDRPVSSEEIVDMAKKLVNRRCARGRALTSPEDSQDFLMLKLSHLEHEVFSAIFLDLCVAPVYVQV
jgi:DNA repair protein RadC